MRARILFALALLAPLAAAADEAPRIPPLTLVTAPPNPYDETADANAVIDAAFERARASGRRVLVNLGGNWCADCRILNGMMQIRVFKAFMDEHYEVAKVDVGDFDRNEDAVRRLGFAGLDALEGVPTVVIATADGRIVNAATSAEWTTASERDPQDALDYFFEYASAEPARNAARVAD